MIDFDRYVLQAALATFGETVIYLNATQQPVSMQAVFDDRFRETTFRDGVEVVETRPVLGMRAANFPVGQLPAQGELFQVQGRYYVISSPVEPDGHGHVKIPLRFATDIEAQRLPVVTP